MFQDTADYPWETTIENPDMVEVGGTYFLLFSTGIWDTPSYSETFATCNGPLGPVRPAGGRTLPPELRGRRRDREEARSSRPVRATGCSPTRPGSPAAPNYSCGGARRLFVAPATFSNSSLPAPVTGIASAPHGRRLLAHRRAGRGFAPRKRRGLRVDVRTAAQRAGRAHRGDPGRPGVLAGRGRRRDLRVRRRRLLRLDGRSARSTRRWST